MRFHGGDELFWFGVARQVQNSVQRVDVKLVAMRAEWRLRTAPAWFAPAGDAFDGARGQ